VTQRNAGVPVHPASDVVWASVRDGCRHRVEVRSQATASVSQEPDHTAHLVIYPSRHPGNPDGGPDR